MSKIILSNEQNKLLLIALNEDHKERHFTFNREAFPDDGEIRPFKLRLNWEALGSLSPEETIKFTRELQTAALFAQRINSSDFYYKTTGEKLLSEEGFNSILEKLRKTIQEEDYALVCYFLKKVGEETD